MGIARFADGNLPQDGRQRRLREPRRWYGHGEDRRALLLRHHAGRLGPEGPQRQGPYRRQEGHQQPGPAAVAARPTIEALGRPLDPRNRAVMGPTPEEEGPSRTLVKRRETTVFSCHTLPFSPAAVPVFPSGTGWRSGVSYCVMTRLTGDTLSLSEA